MQNRVDSPRRRRVWIWLGIVVALALPAVGVSAPAWSQILRQSDDWYGSVEAREIAGHVIGYQTDSGGWPKNLDMTRAPATGGSSDGATIDNHATTTQLWLLGRVVVAQPDVAAARKAVERGIDYLLAAQYANGGWPQFYPLREGYYSHITYNDGAMIDVLSVLRAVAEGRPPFGWVDEGRRAAAASSVQRGVECILRTQVRVNGQLTVWCAQHDRETLAPAPARRFEPASLSGAESVGILEFLMTLPDPTSEMVEAIESGVAWLRTARLEGFRIDRPALPSGRRDQVLVPDPAGVVWARFYDLQTQRPIFAGRDAVVHETLTAVEEERRVGYAYYGTWALTLLERSYPRWRAVRANSADASS